MKQRNKILVCPLDWGLGHATRIIPIVRSLIGKGCEVAIGSSGPALVLLKEEFPAMIFYEIPGYRPVYGSSSSLVLPMARQLPRFFRTIGKEHIATETIARREGFELIISDNRYGCWSDHVPSVFLTHQLNIQAPSGLSSLINFVNHRSIKKFSACWVPDWAGERSLAGNLSSSNGFAVSYIGPLSRFRKEPATKKYDRIAIVSGPEPQREIFERLMRNELRKAGGPSLLVRGLPGERTRVIEGNLEEVNHLPADELNLAILQAEVVIGRPGYSTIMDLAVLGKKAIFVPTPGQTEQVYLGKELMRKRIALCVRQDEFDLGRALADSVAYQGFGEFREDQSLEDAINKALSE